MTTKTNKRLYRMHKDILYRCYNKQHPRYARYGGRGVYLYSEWHDFEKFTEYMLNVAGYADDKIIDRIDNNGNYVPGNVRFVTLAENRLNMDDVWRVPYKGEIKPLSVWCRELGLNYHTTKHRLLRGYSVVDVFEGRVVPFNECTRAANGRFVAGQKQK